MIANKRIYLCLAHMSGREQDFIKEAFDTNWVAPLGPNVNGFEGDLRAYVTGMAGQANMAGHDGEERLDREVVALCSGTAALHLALLACGVGPGDEVIAQSFTFCASVNPIKYIGAVPVLVDSEKETWNMDPDLMEEAIKDRIAKTGKVPKAIVPVTLYGIPYKVDRIMEIADRYGIPVVEDAAEGLGSRFDGRCMGTFGRFGVLSFNGNKMITTSGGGALICPSKEEKDKIMWYATQARESYPYYQHEAVGYNYRMSNVCAGIGRGQMLVLDDHVAHHRHVMELYKELLRDVEGVTLHEGMAGSNYWLNTVTIDPGIRVKGQENVYQSVVQGAIGGAAGVVRVTANPRTGCEPNDNVEALRVYLSEEGIEARPLWKPMHRQPVFKDAPAYLNGVSDAMFKVGLCLPSGPLVTDEDVRRIVRTIREAII
jgi:dTDP-4-amino-4,6-dideoxygalactose transaminase